MEVKNQNDISLSSYMRSLRQVEFAVEQLKELANDETVIKMFFEGHTSGLEISSAILEGATALLRIHSLMLDTISKIEQ